MAFGVKIVNIKTSKPYTIESLYEAIKDQEFSAGKPFLAKHGLVTLIAFPALNSQNQVQILRTGFSEESQKFSVQKAEEAGVGNMVANEVLDKLSGGLFGFGRIGGSVVKQCEALVEATGKELNALNL